MKRGLKLVNENFEKFRKAQRDHKSEYLAGTHNNGRNKSSYNTQENTDKAPGATGKE